MKLTLKKLQMTLQEQIDMMKTQLEKSCREEYELHERADRHLLKLDGFIKETDFNFREVRAEMADLRTEMAGLRAEVAGLRAEVAGLRAEVDGFRTELAELREEMRSGFATIMEYLKRIDNHEVRIVALEAKTAH